MDLAAKCSSRKPQVGDSLWNRHAFAVIPDLSSLVAYADIDEKDIGNALTMGGAALSAVVGFTDGFTGGMVNDFRASWKSDPECAELKEDFSSGLKDIVRQFKAVLHVMSSKVKSVLISRSARQAILRKVKLLLKSVINFLGEVVPGL